MNVDAVSLFLALLAVVAQVVVATTQVLAIGGRLSTRLARARSIVACVAGEQALALAFSVAAVAMADSLYFSSWPTGAPTASARYRCWPSTWRRTPCPKASI